jgi:hypothetical protein
MNFPVKATNLEMIELPDLGKPPLSLVPDKMSIYITFFLSQFSTSYCSFPSGHLIYEKEDFLLEGFRHIWQRHAGRGEYLNANQLQRRVVGPLIPAAEGLVKGFFAKRHADMSLLRDGISAYNTALKKMRDRIEHMHASSATDDDDEWEDTVFACLVMGLYEVRLTYCILSTMYLTSSAEEY